MGYSAFGSVLFGISEPAIFGVTLKYKFPLVAGCLGGMVAGAYVYLSKLTAIGFGTTALPGFAIAASDYHGHINYLVAHLIALLCGALFTLAYGAIKSKRSRA